MRRERLRRYSTAEKLPAFQWRVHSGWQIGYHLLTQLPGHVVQRSAHQMHDAELHLGPGTVAYHKYRIMEILGARSNAELVRYAVRNKMVAA